MGRESDGGRGNPSDVEGVRSDFVHCRGSAARQRKSRVRGLRWVHAPSKAVVLAPGRAHRSELGAYPLTWKGRDGSLLFYVDVPSRRTALLDAGERAMVLQRACLDLLQRFHGRNAAQLAYHVLTMPLDRLDAFRQIAGYGLVGEPQPHLLQRGPFDFAELGDVLLDREAEPTLEGPLRVFKAEALERIEERIVVDGLFEHG